MLRREGFAINHKRVHRIYRAHGLELRPRRKRGVRYVRGNAVVPVSRPNERWSLDFVQTCSVPGGSFARSRSSMTLRASRSGSKSISR
jgi:putative transposase